MKFNQKIISTIVNYFPGVVILIFGMLALHSAVLMIETRKFLSVKYKTYIEDMMTLQNTFYGFELKYDSFVTNPEKMDFSELKTAFQKFGNSFGHIQNSGYGLSQSDQKVYAEYMHYMFLVQDQVQWVSQFLNDRQGRLKVAENKEYTNILHDKIEDLYGNLQSLEILVFQNFENQIYLQDIQYKEIWLYWSVITMALAGFLLIVLNAIKMGQLKAIHEDKKCTIDILENRLAALDLAKDGILIMNASQDIVYLNKSLCGLCGIRDTHRDTLIGSTWRELFSANECAVLEEDILPSLYEKGMWNGDFTIGRDDGGICHAEMSLTRLPDGGVIGTIQDVSEKKKSESEKRELEDQFYQAQKMEAIGRLAGGIAHDFNNILAAMNGYAEFLMDDLKEESDQHKFASNILQAGMQARSLVDQMLSFSRRSDRKYEPINLVESVSEAVSMLRATLPKTIDLCDEVSLLSAPINGNATQISQLIMNLCVNAQDAMEDEHGRLDIEVTQVAASEIKIKDVLKDELPDVKAIPLLRMDDMEAGRTCLLLGHVARGYNYVKLSIKDTGCGMSRVIMEHIFEPFFTTKPVDKGTGLGLATVHGVVVSHQGFMLIDSVLGKGTRFDLFFPLTQKAQNLKSRSITQDDVVEQPDRKTSQKHILLVEDQENVRDMTLKMLERCGYQTSFAVSGMEGLDMVRENPKAYDVILTDYNMPKMNGLEMAQQIHLDFPEIPFILLSGYSEEKIQEIIIGHPAIKEVLRKPISREVLMSKIESVLAAA